MAHRDSSTGKGETPGSAFAGAGDLQPLVAKLLKIARDLDELEGLIAQKREYVIKQLDSITLLGRDEVSERLDMCVAQLDREVRKGALPYIDIDRRPRFSVPDIQAYVETHRATGRAARRRKPKKGPGNEA